MKEGDFSGFIRFYGPLADEGMLDIEKAGKSLVALNKLFNKYQKDIKKIDKDQRYILRISAINKDCTELNCVLDHVSNLFGAISSSGVINTALFGYMLDKTGITEFGKGFFHTLGEQLALKKFSKGKDLKAENKLGIKGEIVAIVRNSTGEEKIIPAEEWENYKTLNPYLGEMIQLEKGKEEEISVGYKIGKDVRELTKVKYSEKSSFDGMDSSSIEDRLNDPFDEESAEEITIAGKFIDYYGLAHKYHFSFQARKNQDDVGKQKILCILPESKISEIIDYLKPENNKNNVCIHGKATRDWDGKIDKIKIDWVNEDANYNPDQKELI